MKTAAKPSAGSAPTPSTIDIMMPHLTGIQLLEALQPLRFHVIFTTAYNQYATKAFRLSAVDFLEKPMN